MILVVAITALAVTLVPLVTGRLTGNRRPGGSVGLNVVGPGAPAGELPAGHTPTTLPVIDLATAPRGEDVPTTAPTIDMSSIMASIAPPGPGQPRVLAFGSEQSGALALTFDDGFCDHCVASLVEAVERTGAHVTLCPNGVYGPTAWNPSADRIKVLIDSGHVALCNHTWSHRDLTRMDAEEVRAELTRNEEWIQATFGVTSRPFYRPPFGHHNDAVNRIAADLGYTQVLMWSGPLGDSYNHVPEKILENMRSYTTAGAVILGHANHPVIAEVFDDLVRITQEAGLTPVTVAELFGVP